VVTSFPFKIFKNAKKCIRLHDFDIQSVNLYRTSASAPGAWTGGAENAGLENEGLELNGPHSTRSTPTSLYKATVCSHVQCNFLNYRYVDSES